MSPSRDRRSPFRVPMFESLEARLVMTAQPWTDSNVNPADSTGLPQPPLAMIADTGSASSLAHIRAQYGFQGNGQTVAIIDTGIAWDHEAFGDGFGTSYRVVGGWDFAENDADPYDDGPFGFHGTHVAGIIGSSDSVHTGVAPGVDLVSLRVFTDQGVSQFSWVESALRWVHEHRYDFANPITTVNLSLGTKVNLLALPNLAMLEDEFAQLRSDGIFISIAAGNAFQSFQSVGLTYPAVSPNVVAVASHDADGLLSSFSQRDDRVLVAPGRDIVSAVPDHLFSGRQQDGFLAGSGTSMAAPFVAGASVLLREAMQFMGHTQIHQDQLYGHFRATADHVFDPVTLRNYSRLDLQAALDGILIDDHADDPSAATSLGQIDQTLSFHGTITQRSDLDQFVLTAAHSGTVRLAFTETVGTQASVWINGVRHELVNGSAEFVVSAGQSLQIGIGEAHKIGHYSGTLNLTRSIEPVVLGRIVQTEFSGLHVAQEQWYQLIADQNGFLTLQSSQGTGIDRLELFDANRVQLATAKKIQGEWRLDHQVEQGSTFFVRVTGSSQNFGLRVANQISLEQGVLTFHGSLADEHVSLKLGGQIDVSAGGIDYVFDAGAIQRIVLNAGGGQDEIMIVGSNADERFRINVGSFWVRGASTEVVGSGFEVVSAEGGGGFDVGILAGAIGNDIAVDASRRSQLQGAGYTHQLLEFDRTRFVSRGGDDWAYLTDSPEDDQLVALPGKAILRQPGRTVIVDQFAGVVARSIHGGWDQAILDGATDETGGVLQSPSTIAATTIRADGFQIVQEFGVNGTVTLVSGSAAAFTAQVTSVSPGGVPTESTATAGLAHGWRTDVGQGPSPWSSQFTGYGFDGSARVPVQDIHHTGHWNEVVQDSKSAATPLAVLTDNRLEAGNPRDSSEILVSEALAALVVDWPFPESLIQDANELRAIDEIFRVRRGNG